MLIAQLDRIPRRTLLLKVLPTLVGMVVAAAFLLLVAEPGPAVDDGRVVGEHAE